MGLFISNLKYVLFIWDCMHTLLASVILKSKFHVSDFTSRNNLFKNDTKCRVKVGLMTSGDTGLLLRTTIRSSRQKTQARVVMQISLQSTSKPPRPSLTAEWDIMFTSRVC